MHQTLTDHEQATITTAATWLSSALGDQVHLASNTTRLTRLFQGYDGELAAFMASGRAAWSIVSSKMPGLRRPAAYFFTVLEGELSPDVGVAAAQVERQVSRGQVRLVLVQPALTTIQR